MLTNQRTLDHRRYADHPAPDAHWLDPDRPVHSACASRRTLWLLRERAIGDTRRSG